jgi:hypothetical protein
LKKVTIRFEDELHSFLKKEADRNKISLNSMIIKIIEDRKNGTDAITNQVIEIQKLLNEVHKVSTASLLIVRENLKESAKSGFLSVVQAENEENGGGDEFVKTMESYVSKKDENVVKIMKGAGLL